MFSQVSIILFTIGLMNTWSLLSLVTARSVRILLECFHVYQLYVTSKTYDDLGNLRFGVCATFKVNLCNLKAGF